MLGKFDRLLLLIVPALLLALQFGTLFRQVRLEGALLSQQKSPKRDDPIEVVKEPFSVSVKHGQLMGSDSAQLVVAEFSDFECPFCSRNANDTLPQLKRDLVAKGKIQYVFNNYPLPFHANAEPAAEAAACAGEQNRFWEMHDHLFSHRGKLAGIDFGSEAKAIGLNMKGFDTCVIEHRFASEITEARTNASHERIKGTPTFFIGTCLSGHLKTGHLWPLKTGH